MVTPRKPNARRGRPPKPKPPKPPPRMGRPPAPLHRHRHRYAVAFFDALVIRLGSERAASQVMLAGAIGRFMTVAETNTTFEIQYSLPPSVIEDRKAERLRPPSVVEEFDRIAEKFRKWARWYTSPHDMVWRKAMARAIAFAFEYGRSDPDSAKLGALIYAGSVDEAQWAHRTLLPWIERGLPQSEEHEDLARFFADFLSQEHEDLARFFADFLSQPTD